MFEEIKDGDFGQNTRDISNNNFEQLYQTPYLATARVMSKLRTFKVYKDDTIRLSIWADSIWNNLVTTVPAKFTELFPDKTIEWRNAQIGGTGADYHAAMMWDVINFNPDLIFIEEFETWGLTEVADVFFRLIKQYTTTDILLNPFPLSKTELDYLIDGDITLFKASPGFRRREYFYSLVGKYGCGMFDPDQLLIRDILQGRVTESNTWCADDVHRTTAYDSVYVLPLIDDFFGDLHQNEYLSLSHSTWFKTIFFRNELELPDLAEGEFSTGDWVIEEIEFTNVHKAVVSSTVGATYEGIIEGIGFELTHFGNNTAGEFKIEIHDGTNFVSPSTLIKDYATSAQNYLTGPHKIIIDTNVLSNDEVERNFTLTMNSATGYTLVDTTNSTTIGTGVITSDEVFAVTSGQITIPANYAGENNWRGTIISGQEYTFQIKKNWYDTITINADMVSVTNRIFGLPRDNYRFKLTVNSGTVTLDAIMELK